MATREELIGALTKAHAAGDKANADVFASMIKEMDGAAPKAAAPTYDDVPTRTAVGYVPSAADNFDPLEGMSKLEKLAAGNTQRYMGLVHGMKQGINRLSGNRIGDEKILAKEAADKAKADEALLKDPWARTGAVTGEASLTAPLIEATGANAVGSKLLPSMGKTAAVGGAEGAVKPGEDYSPWWNAGIGGIAAAGGDALARGVTRVVSPAIQAGSEAVRGQVKRLKDQDVPLLIKNVTDSKSVKLLTDTLEKLPWLGKGVADTERAQKELFTGKVAQAAGTPGVKEIGAGTGRSIMDVPNKAADAIRAQTADIPIPNVAPSTQAALDAARREIGLAGKKPGPMLPNIVNASSPRVPPPVNPTAAQLAAGTRPQQPAPAVPVMTPNEFMNARMKLSDAGMNATGTEKALAKHEQDLLEEAYRQHAGPQGAADFDLWKQQHGLSKDIQAAHLSGKTGAAPLEPEALARQLSDATRENPANASTNQFITDFAARYKGSPESGMNSAMASLLFGTPILGGAAAGMMTDNPVGGTALGSVPLLSAMLLGSKGGSKYLQNQMLTPEMKHIIQQALTTGAITATPSVK